MARSVGTIVNKFLSARNIAIFFGIALMIAIFVNYTFRNAYGEQVSISTGLFATIVFGIAVLTFGIMWKGLFKDNFSYNLSELIVILLIYGVLITISILLVKYTNIDMGIFSVGPNELAQIVLGG